jgi:hypothetical protein
MLARLNTLMMPSLNLQPGLEAYDAMTLAERIEHQIGETWESHQRCLAGYDPTKHPPGSDEEFRNRIATFALEGLPGRKEFEVSVRGSYASHAIEIDRIFSEWMEIVPKQIILIADTTSVFDNAWLFDRMQETIDRLTKLRGSEVIPE